MTIAKMNFNFVKKSCSNYVRKKSKLHLRLNDYVSEIIIEQKCNYSGITVGEGRPEDYTVITSYTFPQSCFKVADEDLRTDTE